MSFNQISFSFTATVIGGLIAFLFVLFALNRSLRGDLFLIPFKFNRKHTKLKRLPQVSSVNFPPAPVHLSYWGINAKVTLDFEVSSEGKAVDIKVKEATHPEVVRPIIDAVSRGSFIPAVDEHGNPVECRMQLPIVTSQQTEHLSASTA